MEYPLRDISRNDMALAIEAIARRMPPCTFNASLPIAYTFAQLQALNERHPELAQSVVFDERRAEWMHERMPANVQRQLRFAIDTIVAGVREMFLQGTKNLHLLHERPEDLQAHLREIWHGMEQRAPRFIVWDPVIRSYIQSSPYAEEMVAAQITIAMASARAVTLETLQE